MSLSGFGKIGFVLLGLLISTSIGLAAPSTNPKCTNGGEGPLCTPSTTTTGLPTGSVDGFVGTLVQILQWLLVAFGVIALIAFVIAGYKYVFSGGDEGAAEEAKEMLKYTIIGIVVALSGYIIITLVQEIFVTV